MQSAGWGFQIRGLLKQGREVSATEDDALDPDGVVTDPEQDDVVPYDGQPRIFANAGAKLIVLGSIGDPAKGLANFLDEADCAGWVVLGNPVGYRFQVAFDISGEFDLHYWVLPGASVKA